VNAQFPITTTPKYNFPLPKENLQLPQQLIELSIRSLKKLQQLQPQPTKNVPLQSTLPEHHEKISPTTSFVKLKLNPTKTPTVAIDVSSIKIGETENGILLAIRGAIVWRQTSHYRYLRLGPFPFHITERNKNEICSFLRCSSEAAYKHEYIMPNFLYMQTRLTTLLERWIQTLVNQTTSGSLILWDGSLMASAFDMPMQAVEELLKEARNRGNTILAFSKMTRLLLHGHRITDLVWKQQPPCLLKIENYPIASGSMRLLGNVYVAKLSAGSCAFRLDVDKELSHIKAVEAVQKLLGNDLILQSYPETLRLAHIFSTFTANEVIGIQRCIAMESNTKIVARPNVRRLLFGRFGKGPEG